MDSEVDIIVVEKLVIFMAALNRVSMKTSSRCFAGVSGDVGLLVSGVMAIQLGNDTMVLAIPVMC